MFASFKIMDLVKEPLRSRSYSETKIYLLEVDGKVWLIIGGGEIHGTTCEENHILCDVLREFNVRDLSCYVYAMSHPGVDSKDGEVVALGNWHSQRFATWMKDFRNGH